MAPVIAPVLVASRTISFLDLPFSSAEFAAANPAVTPIKFPTIPPVLYGRPKRAALPTPRIES